MRAPLKITFPDGSLRWEARLRQSNGSMKTRRFAVKEAAERALREHEDRLDAGINALLDGITFDALSKEWADAHLGVSGDPRASSRKGYIQDLRKLGAFFGGMKLRDIQVATVERFREQTMTTVQASCRAQVAALRAKYARIAKDPRGIRGRRNLAALDAQMDELNARLARIGPHATNKALTRLRQIFKFAQARRYVEFNPASHVKFVKAGGNSDAPLDHNVLDVQEGRALLDAAPAEHRPALMVLLYGGLQLKELLGLSYEDVEFAKNRLLVRQQLEGVTGELTSPNTRAGTRFVELPSFVMTALRQHKLAIGGSEGLVFPYHARRFRSEVFHPSLRRAKLRRIRIHDLRHTCASMLIAAGADPVAVSRQMRHANPAITLQIYRHLFARRSESGWGARMEELVRAEAAVGNRLVGANTAPERITAGAA